MIEAALVIALVSLTAASAAEPQKDRPTVLFMCPHGAAKSVLASAYFARMAQERGLKVQVESAGIEPDETVSAAVATHLQQQGYSIPRAKPRKATADDVQSADVVISIGCDLSGLPPPRGKLLRWDEVPGPGEDFAGADEAIRKRVTQLVEELVQASSRKQ
jgi:arsenate reductase